MDSSFKNAITCSHVYGVYYFLRGVKFSLRDIPSMASGIATTVSSQRIEGGRVRLEGPGFKHVLLKANILNRRIQPADGLLIAHCASNARL